MAGKVLPSILIYTDIAAGFLNTFRASDVMLGKTLQNTVLLTFVPKRAD